MFLDFRKAFDLVNHKILIKKVSMYTNNSALFLKSYLEGRKQKVLLNGSYSNQGLVKHGVPQGSILGPLLFCLFINDLPLAIQNESVTCDMFADDAAVHTPDKDISNINTLQDIDEWCSHNSMILNSPKTPTRLSLTQSVPPRQNHQPSY